MNLHEYQAKQLFSKHNIPVPDGIAVESVTTALDAAEQLGGKHWMVKAQVHAGGRGKAGGIKKVQSETELKDAVESLLNTRLVTHQTSAEGQPINQLLIERPTAIARELYLGIVLDRAVAKPVLMVSTEGGVEIPPKRSRTRRPGPPLIGLTCAAGAVFFCGTPGAAGGCARVRPGLALRGAAPPEAVAPAAAR